MLRPYEVAGRTVRWAISDLMRCNGAPLDQPRQISVENQKRISFLFRNAIYDSPDSLRPPCHRLKAHTYKSVYGRMRWDEPAQTLTSGFTSMGQGRYVHPEHPRTITPHEAARLQFIPDFFQLDDHCCISWIAQMIANAVPMKMTYILVLELLR